MWSVGPSVLRANMAALANPEHPANYVQSQKNRACRDAARTVLSKCFFDDYLIYGQHHCGRLAHAAGGSGDGQT